MARLEQSFGPPPGEFSHLSDAELWREIAVYGRIALAVPEWWPALDKDFPSWRDTVQEAGSFAAAHGG